MRGVRQAVSRCERAGLTVSCHRVRDLDERGTLATIRARAEQWRDGEVERGFSMALGRLVSSRPTATRSWCSAVTADGASEDC